MKTEARDRRGFSPTNIRLPFGGQASSCASHVRRPGWVLFGERVNWGILVTGFFFLALICLVISTVWPAEVGSISRVARPTIRALFLIVLVSGIINQAFYAIGFFSLFCTRWDARPPDSQMEGAAFGGNSIKTQPTVAIAMAIYHEDTDQVWGVARQMWRSLRQAGLIRQCDFFLLCDSTDPAIRSAEEEMHRKLVEEFSDGVIANWRAPDGEEARGGLYLIRRPDRTNYKVGNITSFLENYGWAYDYMLELDADSFMMGSRIKQMISRMEADPKLGLLQATVLPYGGETLFAKSIGYSMSRILPLHAIGMARVFGTQCTFWGHNALIRVRSFLRHARLPIMPGSPPLGGSILSHDIVEAALLGRGGCSVEWDLECTGSFDRMPEDAISYGRRDRRWCQGNFQHFWLIFGDGIKFWHRFYFINGIVSYLCGPGVIVLTLLGFAQMATNPSDSGQWSYHPKFIVVMLSVLGFPRALGLLRLIVLWSKLERRGVSSVGRFARELASSLTDLLLSIAVAPMLFYLHLRAAVEILTGQAVSWKAQVRRAVKLSWREATSMFGVPTLLGIAWVVAAMAVAPEFLPYLIPLVFGWVFSIPIAVVTSHPALGGCFARLGLFEDCLMKDEAAEMADSIGGDRSDGTERPESLVPVAGEAKR